eukprot:366380-Chlamydomonas_euryale.AAC.6
MVALMFQPLLWRRLPSILASSLSRKAVVVLTFGHCRCCRRCTPLRFHRMAQHDFGAALAQHRVVVVAIDVLHTHGAAAGGCAGAAGHQLEGALHEAEEVRRRLRAAGAKRRWGCCATGYVRRVHGGATEEKVLEGRATIEQRIALVTAMPVQYLAPCGEPPTVAFPL